MGYDIKQPIMLTDKVTATDVANLGADAAAGTFENRAEYKLLLTQQALNALDLKNVKAGYIPKVYGSFSAGSLTAASKFNKLTEFDTRWADYSQIGVQIQVPIFDSFQKYWQGQQKKVAIEKTKNTIEQFKRSVSLQTASASVNLENALLTLQTQKRTLELAQEVVRVTKAKYQQGIGSNFEVTTAEADLKDAQVNYFNATLDALNAKVDLDVATGKLYNE
jgi:outer membrane protein TolC